MDFDLTLVLFIVVLSFGGILFVNRLLRLPAIAQLIAKFFERTKHKIVASITRLITPIWQWLLELARSLFVIFLVVFCIRAFVVEPFQIPSGSMRPTLEIGDFIVVNKLSFGARLPIVNKRVFTWTEIERGDIIVFNFPKNERLSYIKRVVGVPGDVVIYNEATVSINDKPLITIAATEQDDSGLYTFFEHNGDAHYSTYRDNAKPRTTQPYTFEVPPDHYFVMGDNRDNSNDSRFWGFVHKDLIQGKASLVWMHWPHFWSLPDFSTTRFIH